MRSIVASSSLFSIFAVVAVLASFAVGITGCESPTSCQSGPKYGTQCYNGGGQQTYSSGDPTQPPTSPQSTPTSPMPSREAH